jgi:hypothetical protein
MHLSCPPSYGGVENRLGWMPLFPCFLDGNTNFIILYKYAARQKQAFEFGCAYGQDPTSRRGSYVYKINNLKWLCNLGRPQPRVRWPRLSVAKTGMNRRQYRSETSRAIPGALGRLTRPASFKLLLTLKR